MKIKINREVEVPDGFCCANKGKMCLGLNTEGYDYPKRKTAQCQNFNATVFFPDGAPYFVKCRACIDAALAYLNGAAK
jgi:hypothetical protein